MEHLPPSFQCEHCAYQLVLTLPSNEAVSGPCPVCANVITFDPNDAQHAPVADLEPEIEEPVLLPAPPRHFRRSRFAGNRRSTRKWFKSDIDTPVTSDGVPLVIKRRRKASFVPPERLANRLERLSQGAR